MNIAIIQARLGSTRYPKKIIKAQVDGVNLLENILDILVFDCSFDKVVLAIPYGETDEIMSAIPEWRNIIRIEGSEEDVLSRFINAATEIEAKDDDWIFRFCADSPFPDPLYVGYVMESLKRKYDAVVCLDLPPGRQVEAFTFSCLKRAYKYSEDNNDQYLKEHIDPLLDILDNDDGKLFKVLRLPSPNLTIDTKNDERKLSKITK